MILVRVQIDGKVESKPRASGDDPNKSVLVNYAAT